MNKKQTKFFVCGCLCFCILFTMLGFFLVDRNVKQVGGYFADETLFSVTIGRNGFFVSVMGETYGGGAQFVNKTLDGINGAIDVFATSFNFISS